MHYPVVLFKTEGNYRVVVPDINDCESNGTTVADALQNVVVSIEHRLEGLVHSGDPLPTPRRVEDHQNSGKYSDGIWALVSVDVSKLLGNVKRINITLPERLLTLIDRFTATRGGNRSGFLADAALNYISRAQYGKERRKQQSEQPSKSTTMLD